MERISGGVVASALLLGAAHVAFAQWVVPCDPSSPRAFSCWPRPTLLERRQPPAEVGQPRLLEEEQEPLSGTPTSLMIQDKDVKDKDVKEKGLKDKDFKAPPPQKHEGPSLVEMAAMGNLPQPIVERVYYAEPVHHHPHQRSFQECWMDCQDRLEHHYHALKHGVSSFWHRLRGHGGARSSCGD